MRQKTVRQKEIADLLGVSIATISRVLNDQPGVSPELREKVLDLIGQTNYSPDMRARSLATAATHTAAFVTHKFDDGAADDPFYPLILTGAEWYLSQYDYHILLAALEHETMVRPQTFAAFRERRIDGLILAGPYISTSFILHMLASNIPVVLVDNSLSQAPVNCIVSDDRGGAYAAACHLVEHGHKRIVCLTGPEGWASTSERIQGYAQAITEAGLEPAIVRSTDTTIAAGAIMMREALTKWPDLTAICAANDAMAIGAIRAARKAGRYVPDDVAVMGFDDISWAGINDPPLSTVHVYKRRMGQLAGQCLLDTIRDPTAAPTKTIVSTTLMIRQSCGCPEQPGSSQPAAGLEITDGSATKEVQEKP